MPRRRGGDKLFQNKKEAQKKEAFKREKNRLNKKPDVIISCEDSVSAPTYFQNIIDILISKKLITQDSFVVVPHDGSTNPSNVLKRLEKYENRDNGKKYKDFICKWIVIDRDTQRTNGGGHTAEDFNVAIQRAKKLKVEVAYSNDAFEFWYLLHFNYENTPILRDDINKKLIKKLQEKHAFKFSKLNKDNIKDKRYTKLIFDELFELQDIAIQNAQNLLKYHGLEHNPEKDNPVTTVHLLIQVLNKLNCS